MLLPHVWWFACSKSEEKISSFHEDVHKVLEKLCAGQFEPEQFTLRKSWFMSRQHWFKAVLSDWPVMEKNCETILYLNFNPTRATWKTRDYSLTWLTLALIMGCVAQQASFEVPHPHPPEMRQIWKYSTPSAPMWIQSIIPPINKKKSLLTELPGAQGVWCPSSPSAPLISPPLVSIASSIFCYRILFWTNQKKQESTETPSNRCKQWHAKAFPEASS